jgi:hypothetical protein
MDGRRFRLSGAVMPFAIEYFRAVDTDWRRRLKLEFQLGSDET